MLTVSFLRTHLWNNTYTQKESELFVNIHNFTHAFYFD